MKYCHLWQHGWILRICDALSKLSHMKKVKNHIWDIKLKTTNEQTRQTNENSHTDNSVVVTSGAGVRGREDWRVSDVCWGKETWFGWWTHSAVYRWRVIELYTWDLNHFINHCRPNKLNKKEKIIMNGRGFRTTLMKKTLKIWKKEVSSITEKSYFNSGLCSYLHSGDGWDEPPNLSSLPLIYPYTSPAHWFICELCFSRSSQ